MMCFGMGQMDYYALESVALCALELCRPVTTVRVSSPTPLLVGCAPLSVGAD